MLQANTMKTCTEPLLWNCQRCGNPFQYEEWESAGRGCPVCHQSVGGWKCGKCAEPFAEPGLSETHPCKAKSPPPPPRSGPNLTLPLPWPKLAKWAAAGMGILVVLGFLISRFGGTPPNSSDNPANPQRDNETPASSGLNLDPIIPFFRKYSDAVKSQNARRMIPFFSETRPIFYYGKMLTRDQLAELLQNEHSTSPIMVDELVLVGYMKQADPEGRPFDVVEFELRFQRQDGTVGAKKVQIAALEEAGKLAIFYEGNAGQAVFLNDRQNR